MKKKSHYRTCILIILICTAVLHIAACFKQFCDWYTDNLYPYWAEWLGRLNAKLPFVLGEWLIILAAVLVLLAVIFLILLPFLRGKERYRRFTAGYCKTLLMIFCGSVLYYSLVWAVPFRGTALGKPEKGLRTEFSYQEIDALMRYVADGANSAAEEIEIHADGTVDFPTPEESRRKTEAALHDLSAEYPRLNGYYPPVKDAFSSDILRRMDIGGVTFPYTMEVLHEKYYAQNPIARLITDAHELTHHMGFYKESAATFLSALALSQSDDPFLRFAAFKEMYFYVEADYMEARVEYMDALRQAHPEIPALEWDKLKEMQPDERKALMQKVSEAEEQYAGVYPYLSERAWDIWTAAAGNEQEAYEAETHPIDAMPAVDQAIGKAGDAGWTAQYAVLQEHTYEGSVLLLLQYFDGKLY
ncbi:MAG: DUF3810 family protein [Oscillospiraceae bacterium]|nr:DUF3810 family protein [Oscillospiraceae bacterium]